MLGPATGASGLKRESHLGGLAVPLMPCVSESIAEVKELIGIGGYPYRRFQLLCRDLFLTATGAGDVRVNDLIIRDRIYQASFKQADLILTLP